MIPADYFATMTVEHVIFHDIPRRVPGGESAPVLADGLTDMDARHKSMLKEKLTRTLQAKSAYDIMFNDESASPVPDNVMEITNARFNSQKFIVMSRRFAEYLFEQQTGQMSAGLLCVIWINVKGRRVVAILKLERERGVELSLEDVDGSRQFTMDLLDNLVFTDGTKTYKSAMFVSEADDEYKAVACDKQKNVHSGRDVGQFWMRFLGCKVTVEPRVATELWFDATVRYVNDFITDPMQKDEVYNHIVSELHSNRATITPGTFAEDYMPKDYRQGYRDYLVEVGVSVQRFHKDLADVERKIKSKTYITRGGVTVKAPFGEEDLVQVRDNDILIDDILETIVKE